MKRYQTSNGKQWVMNIVGKPGRNMVNFMKPTDYLFGNPSENERLGSEQGGVYERSIVGFRLENYDLKKIDKMHQYFENLKHKEENKEVKFSLICLPSFIQIPFITKAYEKGNCAYWTSKGMVAGILFFVCLLF